MFERSRAGFNGRMAKNSSKSSQDATYMILFHDKLKLYRRLEGDQLHIKCTFIESNKCSNYFVQPSYINPIMLDIVMP